MKCLNYRSENLFSNHKYDLFIRYRKYIKVVLSMKFFLSWMIFSFQTVHKSKLTLTSENKLTFYEFLTYLWFLWVMWVVGVVVWVVWFLWVEWVVWVVILTWLVRESFPQVCCILEGVCTLASRLSLGWGTTCQQLSVKNLQEFHWSILS